MCIKTFHILGTLSHCNVTQATSKELGDLKAASDEDEFDFESSGLMGLNPEAEGLLHVPVVPPTEMLTLTKVP